jgi:hypothetical protein
MEQNKKIVLLLKFRIIFPIKDGVAHGRSLSRDFEQNTFEHFMPLVEHQKNSRFS